MLGFIFIVLMVAIAALLYWRGKDEREWRRILAYIEYRRQQGLPVDKTDLPQTAGEERKYRLGSVDAAKVAVSMRKMATLWHLLRERLESLLFHPVKDEEQNEVVPRVRVEAPKPVHLLPSALPAASAAPADLPASEQDGLEAVASDEQGELAADGEEADLPPKPDPAVELNIISVEEATRHIKQKLPENSDKGAETAPAPRVVEEITADDPAINRVREQTQQERQALLQQAQPDAAVTVVREITRDDLLPAGPAKMPSEPESREEITWSDLNLPQAPKIQPVVQRVPGKEITLADVQASRAEPVAAESPAPVLETIDEEVIRANLLRQGMARRREGSSAAGIQSATPVADLPVIAADEVWANLAKTDSPANKWRYQAKRVTVRDSVIPAAARINQNHTVTLGAEAVAAAAIHNLPTPRRTDTEAGSAVPNQTAPISHRFTPYEHSPLSEHTSEPTPEFEPEAVVVQAEVPPSADTAVDALVDVYQETAALQGTALPESTAAVAETLEAAEVPPAPVLHITDTPTWTIHDRLLAESAQVADGMAEEEDLSAADLSVPVADEPLEFILPSAAEQGGDDEVLEFVLPDAPQGMAEVSAAQPVAPLPAQAAWGGDVGSHNVWSGVATHGQHQPDHVHDTVGERVFAGAASADTPPWQEAAAVAPLRDAPPAELIHNIPAPLPPQPAMTVHAQAAPLPAATMPIAAVTTPAVVEPVPLQAASISIPPPAAVAAASAAGAVATPVPAAAVAKGAPQTALGMALQQALQQAPSSPPEAEPVPTWTLPGLNLLLPPQYDPTARQSEEALLENSITIEEKLAEFKVKVSVQEAYAGPVITRYEIEPAQGVRGNQVVNLEKDLARSLGVLSIRVVENIPGKTCMGLELPNPQRQLIRLSEIFNSPAFQQSQSKLTLALGQDIIGEPVVTDLAKAPHMLVAGTTGSGKSVGVNAMILSLLFKADPSEVRLIMIDPKMLEFSMYEGIPHLLAPVVTDMKLAVNALTWCVEEMEKRYRLMSHVGVRNLVGFNQKISEAAAQGRKLANPFSLTPDDPEPLEKLPYIVVMVDEFADLMMSAGKKIEELIARLAQKARAAGIHLILATQRPSVDVITGLIKANIPTRISFQVSSKIDSRTILDQMGAENLLGDGDMLFLPPGIAYPKRVHGAFVADEEIQRVVAYLKQLGEPDYEDILSGSSTESVSAQNGSANEEQDPLYDEAVALVLKTRRGSISSVQRHFRIGYNRAARLVEQMEVSGIVSPAESNGNRTVLVPAPAHLD